MRTLLAFALGSVSIVLLGAVSGVDSEASPPAVAAAAQDPEAMAKMMEQAKKFTTPGKHHEQLKRFLGKWKSSARFIMGGQKSAPETGVSECTWLMEGRWLQVKGKTSLMGKPFENFIVLGYDNFKQSYVMTSVSSMDTAMLRSEGDMTQHGDALVFYGQLDEYLTGEHDKMAKYVYRFVSDKEMVLEVHDLAIGLENTQVVEIRFEKVD
ncbi:MAG: DUF1579 domain-containing protein [bacterium]|nr:DUF1579 domain-containing protein [bacterium]